MTVNRVGLASSCPGSAAACAGRHRQDKDGWEDKPAQKDPAFNTTSVTKGKRRDARFIGFTVTRYPDAARARIQTLARALRASCAPLQKFQQLLFRAVEIGGEEFAQGDAPQRVARGLGSVQERPAHFAARYQAFARQPLEQRHHRRVGQRFARGDGLPHVPTLASPSDHSACRHTSSSGGGNSRAAAALAIMLPACFRPAAGPAAACRRKRSWISAGRQKEDAPPAPARLRAQPEERQGRRAEPGSRGLRLWLPRRGCHGSGGAADARPVSAGGSRNLSFFSTVRSSAEL